MSTSAKIGKHWWVLRYRLRVFCISFHGLNVLKWSSIHWVLVSSTSTAGSHTLSTDMWCLKAGTKKEAGNLNRTVDRKSTDVESSKTELQHFETKWRVNLIWSTSKHKVFAHRNSKKTVTFRLWAYKNKSPKRVFITGPTKSPQSVAKPSLPMLSRVARRWPPTLAPGELVGRRDGSRSLEKMAEK